MILRVIFLFSLMVTALAGMFKTKQIVNTASDKTTFDKIFKMPALREWNTNSSNVARALMEKYGMPDEETATMLIWINNAPWEKTIVYKNAINHNFPFSHADILEQTIKCRVPEEKLNDLLSFNGSITVNRTNGTLSIRCMNEHLNILALNYAYQILKENKLTGEARLEYYKQASGIMTGNVPEAAQYLMLRNDQNSADPR